MWLQGQFSLSFSTDLTTIKLMCRFYRINMDILGDWEEEYGTILVMSFY